MKTNGVLLAVMLVLGMTCSLAAQEYVNGYTYVAPSYYLSPPIVTAGPPYVAGVDVYGPTFAPHFSRSKSISQPRSINQSLSRSCQLPHITMLPWAECIIGNA